LNIGSFNTASGLSALYWNTVGTNNVATGVQALYFNSVGNDNTATGMSALRNNTASFNTAHGTSALSNTTTGGWNVAVGDRAGLNATTGSYNVFLGASVYGTAADTNTIRIGLPYGDGIGQNKTFIAGIFGTPLTGAAYNVYIDANGQLGTVAVGGGGGFLPMAQLQQQARMQQGLQDQQAAIVQLQRQNDELRARLARVEALLLSATGRK
jgi:hypothetical protein